MSGRGDEPRQRRYRVAQWATGNIGTRSLSAIIDHPRLDLVGLLVYSDEKAGRDAGELCGRPPTGVVATTSIDDIVSSGADCVVHMPRSLDADQVCALLSAGINVVTCRGEFHHPPSMNPALRARVEAACRQGGATVHSTGSSPGFITEALPLVLTSLQRRLDRMTIDEFADVSSRNSPNMVFKIMGFGGAPATFDDRKLAHMRESFIPSLQVVADAMGTPLTSFEVFGETAVATRSVEIAAGTIPAGTVAAQRITVSGKHQSQTELRFRANWYCATELEPAWDMRSTGWQVSVEGDAPFELSIRFTTPPERAAAVTPGYTAHRAVNAIPVVCEAEPGIRTSTELPQIWAQLA